MGIRSATAVGLALVFAFLLGMRCASNATDFVKTDKPVSDAVGSIAFDRISIEEIVAASCDVTRQRIDLPTCKYLFGRVQESTAPHRDGVWFSVSWDGSRQGFVVDGSVVFPSSIWTDGFMWCGTW